MFALTPALILQAGHSHMFKGMNIRHGKYGQYQAVAGMVFEGGLAARLGMT
ncbi:MAG TPA: hypothetical protein VL997_05835 [Dyella sp.]|nr:hypothetical protein [Dyella sp.]